MAIVGLCMCGTWCEALHGARVGCARNFFDAPGVLALDVPNMPEHEDGDRRAHNDQHQASSHTFRRTVWNTVRRTVWAADDSARARDAERSVHETEQPRAASTFGRRVDGRDVVDRLGRPNATA